MKYQLNTDLFDENFLNTNGKLTHKQGNYFKLFPFITTPNSPIVEDLDNLVGRILCEIEGISPQDVSVEELINKLKQKTEIEVGQEDAFHELIKQLFFDENGKIRPINIRLLEQIITEESSEKRIADYLVDVLGKKDRMKALIKNANDSLMARSNVLESLVFSQLSFKNRQSDDYLEYYRVVDTFVSKFEEDFAYILESNSRTREYLIPLFEFYYFVYTSQTCLQLDRFLDGERDSIVPLYFSLDWEKTSLSRKCYTEGWQILQRSIRRIFAHSITLEILNLSEESSDRVDYIAINKFLEEHPEEEAYLAENIKVLTDKYRSAITDCPEMNELIPASGPSSAEKEVAYLFNSVKTQFENTGRERAYDSYANKFEYYCSKYLKSRGRSGLILNLTEETLIFLTKLSIKNNETMRLVDVFNEFEARGIFLDDISKDQVAEYYEKLNLIEKKSDSGDAKYVKRIL